MRPRGSSSYEDVHTYVHTYVRSVHVHTLVNGKSALRMYFGSKFELQRPILPHFAHPAAALWLLLSDSL